MMDYIMILAEYPCGSVSKLFDPNDRTGIRRFLDRNSRADLKVYRSKAVI